MTKRLGPDDLTAITSLTLKHYGSHAQSFWEGTKDHDVGQNYEAFLGAMPAVKGLRILDLGCGPGRDLLHFKALGHVPVGLDGSPDFCRMAHKISGCQILQQNFLQLDLVAASFAGIFANASLFHVPRQELGRVLTELHRALVPGGILFSSTPRGSEEGWSGDRYGNYLEYPEYETFLRAADFEPLRHYYRPAGLPLDQQPWLAVVCRAGALVPAPY